MALAAALTVLMALLPAGLASNNNSKSLTVTCTEQDSSKQKEVTAADTVLTVLCPKSWTIDPAVNEPQEVYETDQCTGNAQLSHYSSKAKTQAVINESTPGMKITFGELPGTKQSFYLACNEKSNGKKCCVEVILNELTAGTPGPDGAHPQPPPPGSGTPSVQTCKANASITLKIPEKGSSAQFACETGFDLYPTEKDKVFSKDCKKKETLSDMTRTQTTAAGTETDSRSEESSTYTYTLKADKKPSKKTLCYLCAEKGTTAAQPGTAANYCTIYVESGARTQLNLSFTFILAWPCVLAAL